MRPFFFLFIVSVFFISCNSPRKITAEKNWYEMLPVCPCQNPDRDSIRSHDGWARESRNAEMDILKKMFETGLDPEEILVSENLHTVSDRGELENVVREVLVENEAAVADYKKGKEASLQFMIGKAMAKLRGRGKPDILKELFLQSLK